MAVNIATSTSATATAYSNQRKIDHCQNGVLWSTFVDLAAAVWKFFYSTDNGATWTDSTNNITLGTGSAGYNGSFFIDLDDNAHFVYKSNFDGFIYYRRGTPNTGRTSWAWSAAQVVYNSATSGNYPDVVAFRDPAGGGGWVVHIAWSYVNGGVNEFDYDKYTVSSGGVFTHSVINSSIGTGYNTGINTWPSIDFEHTGDGKTAANSSPALFCAWSAGSTGSGKGIRFRKATYSAGAWIWGTEREIDSAYVHVNIFTSLSCLFDGQEVVIGGMLNNGTNYHVRVYQRDLSDTTTTTLGDFTVSSPNWLESGSLTYDSARNVYVFGSDENGNIKYRKYDRAANTFTTLVTVESGVTSSTASTVSYPSLKRGYSNSKLEWIYTDGSASPYSIKYDSLALITNISISRTLKWNVRLTGPTISRTLKWNVRGGALISRTLLWNTKATIPVSRTLIWNVKVTVPVVSRTLIWNVKIPAIITRTLRWRVFGPWVKVSPTVDVWTDVNENDAAWTPEAVESTTWR